MLKRIIASAVVLSFLASAVAGTRALGADESVSGRWKLTYKVEEEAKDYLLTLKQDGEKVSGELVSPRSQRKDPFDGGTLAGSKLKLEIKRQNEEVFSIEAERKSAARFEGKLLINGRGPVELVLSRDAPIAILGKWKAISKSPDGQEYPSTVELTDEGGALKGKSTSNLGTIAFDSVAFDGKKFEFQVTLPIDGNSIAFRVSAELKDANKLAGNWKTRDADFSGEWFASREVAEAPKPTVEPPKPAPPVLEAGAKGLAGKWHAVVDAPDGKKSAVLEFAVDGSKLTGKVHTTTGAVVDIQEGTASGNKAQFSFTIKVDANEMKIKIDVELGAGDVLKGRWSIPSGDSGEIRARKPLVL